MYKLEKKKVKIKGHKKYLIDEIFALRVKYGLRNISEYARAKYQLKKYRRAMATHPKTIKEVRERLIRLGILKKDMSLFDLNVEDFLKNRLQSVVALKYGISMRHARSLIVNKKVLIDKHIVKYPSYYPRVLKREKIFTIGLKNEN